MKVLWLLALVPLAALAFAQGQSDDETEDEAGPLLIDEEQAAQPSPARIAAAMELRSPGAEHRLLTKMAGEWSAETKIWATPSTASPMAMYGSLEARMILGGRFLRLEGQAGEGDYASERVAILGFDRRWGEYTSVEFDNWGTYAVRARGTYDPQTHTLSLIGEDRDPILEVTQKYNFVYEFVDEDTIVNSVVFLDGSHGNSGPFKLVETTLRRR